jgi:FMN reductase
MRTENVKNIDNHSLPWLNLRAMASVARRSPYIVGLGGTAHSSSTTDSALRLALQVAAAAGAQTMQLSGSDLSLPMYTSQERERTPAARRLVEELRKADGIIIASPSYHGSMSGYVKNALDYAEDLRGDASPYFEGRAVGCIAVAGGWPAAMLTLSTLRSVVHALRGWPTPLGVPIVTVHPKFDSNGSCLDSKIQEQLEIMARQVHAFASWRAATATAARVAHPSAAALPQSETM